MSIEKLKEMHCIIESIIEKEHFLIAGGCCCDAINGEPSKDFDIFVKTDGGKFGSVRDHLMKSGFEIIRTRNLGSIVFRSIATGDVIDLVPCYNSPLSQVSTFDLVHSCLYFDGEDICEAVYGALYVAKEQRLEINVLSMPYHTVARVGKFMKRGFEPLSERSERELLKACYATPLVTYESY